MSKFNEIIDYILLLTILISFYLIFKIPLTLYGDNLIQNFPLLYEVSRQIKSGNLPLWTPFIYGGQSLIGNPQAGVWYPFFWLFFLLPVNLYYKLDLVTIFHIIIAFYSIRKFLKFIGIENRNALLFGGLFYSIGGYSVIIFVGSINMWVQFALLPLVLYYFLKILKNANSNKNIINFTIFFSLMFLSGYVQYVIYTLIILIILFIFYSEKLEFKKVLISFFKMSILISLIILPQIVIVSNFMKNCIRNVKISFFSPFSFKEFITPYFDWSFILGSVIPLNNINYFFGVKYNSYPIYIGIIEAFLLIYAFHLTFQNKIKNFLPYIIILFFSLFSSMNIKIFQYILYHIPVLNIFRGAAKHVFELQFALTIIITLALEFFLKSKKWKSPKLKLIIFIYFLSFFLFKSYYAINFTKIFQKFSYSDLNFFIKNSKENFYRVFSVYKNDKNVNKLLYPYNFPILASTYSLNGYGPTLPSKFHNLFNMDISGATNNFKNIKWEYLPCLNVKYILSSIKLERFLKFYTFKNIKDNIYIYENTETCGFVYSPQYLSNDLTKLKRFPCKYAILKNIPLKNKQYEIKVIDFKYSNKNPSYFKLKIFSKGKTFLVVSLLYDSNWDVKINGKKVTKIFKVNDLIIGFYINKGLNDIEISYNLLHPL